MIPVLPAIPQAQSSESKTGTVATSAPIGTSILSLDTVLPNTLQSTSTDWEVSTRFKALVDGFAPGDGSAQPSVVRRSEPVTQITKPFANGTTSAEQTGQAQTSDRIVLPLKPQTGLQVRFAARSGAQLPGGGNPMQPATLQPAEPAIPFATQQTFVRAAMGQAPVSAPATPNSVPLGTDQALNQPSSQQPLSAPLMRAPIEFLRSGVRDAPVLSSQGSRLAIASALSGHDLPSAAGEAILVAPTLVWPEIALAKQPPEARTSLVRAGANASLATTSGELQVGKISEPGVAQSAQEQPTLLKRGSKEALLSAEPHTAPAGLARRTGPEQTGETPSQPDRLGLSRVSLDQVPDGSAETDAVPAQRDPAQFLISALHDDRNLGNVATRLNGAEDAQHAKTPLASTTLAILSKPTPEENLRAFGAEKKAAPLQPRRNSEIGTQATSAQATVAPSPSSMASEHGSDPVARMSSAQPIGPRQSTSNAAPDHAPLVSQPSGIDERPPAAQQAPAVQVLPVPSEVEATTYSAQHAIPAPVVSETRKQMAASLTAQRDSQMRSEQVRPASRAQQFTAATAPTTSKVSSASDPAKPPADISNDPRRIADSEAVSAPRSSQSQKAEGEPLLQTTSKPAASQFTPASSALAPAVPPAPSQSAPASAPTANPQSVDAIDTAIDRLIETRETARAQRPELTVRNSEFGAVHVRLEAVGGNLRATLANRDPGFVPAVQSALVERAVVASNESTMTGQRAPDQQQSSSNSGQNAANSGAQSQFEQRYGSSTGSGQGSSQPYSEQYSFADASTAENGPGHRSDGSQNAPSGNGVFA